MLPTYYVGREGDMCTCGRRKSLIHCPSCGTFRVHRLKRPEIINGKEVYYYVCEKCSLRFEEIEQQNHCEAPLYETKAQRVVGELLRTRSEIDAGNNLTKKEQKLAPVVKEHIPPSAGAQELQWRRNWMAEKLSGKTSISCNEYVARMREMEKEGVVENSEE